jgi:glycerol-1-phosphate dehydrogenase [NAD(P)+]
MTGTASATVDDLTDVRALVAGAAPEENLRTIGTREIVRGPGALGHLSDVVTRLQPRPGSPVVVLSDDVAKLCGGRDVVDIVVETLTARWEVRRVVLPGGGHGVSRGVGQDPAQSAGLDDEVHADEATLDAAVQEVGAAAAGALVSVGSGTVADIGKSVAQRLDLTHVVVQTAASVNGFADDQSVLLLNGTKRTTPSRWPEAIVIDSRVLAASPVRMTRSGLGDLLSTYTGAADWMLASVVGFDPTYSPTAVAVLRSGIDETMAAATGLRTNHPEALEALAASLTHGGLAMGVAGRTSPSSGAEHTISHLLEMSATALARSSAHHGEQVGAASVVIARVWAAMRERLRAGECVVRPLDPHELQVRVHAAFTHLDRTGAMARECWSAYERKLLWINDHLDQVQAVCEGWAQHDDAIGALLATPQTLTQTLESAGASASLCDLDPGPTRGTARWAVQNCHLMRDRFTIVDLAELTGHWTDQDVDVALAGDCTRAAAALAQGVGR